MIDEDRFRRLEVRAIRKLANVLGVSSLEELKGASIPGGHCRFQGIVMAPDLGGLVVWCEDDSGRLLMRPWLDMMRRVHLALGARGNVSDHASECDDLSEIEESVWSEYISTEDALRLLGIEELTLHRFRWAAGEVGWLRCKELYGDESNGIVYRWSVLLDRVLGV